MCEGLSFARDAKFMAAGPHARDAGLRPPDERQQHRSARASQGRLDESTGAAGDPRCGPAIGVSLCSDRGPSDERDKYPSQRTHRHIQGVGGSPTLGREWGPGATEGERIPEARRSRACRIAYAARLSPPQQSAIRRSRGFGGSRTGPARNRAPRLRPRSS